MFELKTLVKSALAGAVLAAMPLAATALTVKLEDSGGASLTITDGDGNDTNALADAIGYSGVLAGFTITLTGATANDDAGAGTSDLNSIALDISGAGTLKISASHTGYAGGALSPSSSNLSFDINGTKLGGSLTASAYVDTTNTLFGMADQIGSTQSFSSGAPFGGQMFDSAVLTSPFSMTSVITLTQTGGQTSFDATAVAAVPVPAAGLMLLTALGGLGVARRRRKAA